MTERLVASQAAPRADQQPETLIEAITHVADGHRRHPRGRQLDGQRDPVQTDWRASFREIAEFLTGQQAEVADDRVLATVLFTDIVDSTRRAAEMGDRDWHALLDAHDAVVRSQLGW